MGGEEVGRAALVTKMKQHSGFQEGIGRVEAGKTSKLCATFEVFEL